MPNWTTNYTTFIGTKETINIIHSYFDTEEDIFDFDKVAPMPELLRATASPVNIINDEEFEDEHGVLPETKEGVEKFLLAYKKQEEQTKKHFFLGLPDMTNTMSTILLDNYGANNWYDWHVHHWGVKWEGTSVSIEYKSDNILLARYETPWDTPEEIFETLESKFADLAIFNMAHFEGYGDSISSTRGDDYANKFYWTITHSGTLDFPNEKITADNLESVIPYTIDECRPDVDNLDTMVEHNIFIDDNGEAQFLPGIEDTNVETK